MEQEPSKSDLIEWLAKLEDEETIEFLKQSEDANVLNEDWGCDLTEEMKSGIARGLKDVDDGSVTPHDTIKGKYGL